MPATDITQTTTTTDPASSIPNFSVQAKSTDGTGVSKNSWSYPEFTQRYGYYLKIPELKKAIDVYATWVIGKGFEANVTEQVQIDHIRGWGEDTFLSIIWNMLVMKKVNGDSFAEIMRDPKTRLIVNLKPLSPQDITIHVSKKGIIEYYMQDTTGQKIMPENMFHLCNDRVADNIHGESVIDAVKWTVDAVQESLADKRRQLHLSTIRVMEVDEDDKTRMAQIKTDYATAIKLGSLLLVPKGTAQLQDLVPPTTEHIEWTRYLENRFYKAVGIPKSLVGDVEGSTESGGKMAYLSHEPIYSREVTELEADIFNQIGLKVTFNKQASLQESVNDTENKNTNQTQAAQPSDVIQGGVEDGQEDNQKR